MKTSEVLINSVILAMVIGGCSKPLEQPKTMTEMQIATTYDPQAAFPTSARYVFLRQRPEDAPLDEETLTIIRRLRDAIKDELKSQKYKLGRDEVDYIVDYQIVAQHSMSILAERAKIEGEEWITVIGVPDDFIQGALVIDVIDAKDLRPVWRGLCNANIALDKVSEEEKSQRARYAVQQLLSTFPPQQ